MSWFSTNKNYKPKKGNGDTIKKRRGRPITKTERTRATIPARLSVDCWTHIKSQQRTDNESISDTIMRLLTHERNERIHLRKKVEALEGELRRPYLSRSSNLMNEVVNQPLQVILN